MTVQSADTAHASAGRRGPSLASRIVLATVSVALLAALATAGVAYQLVRQVTIQQSRDVLRSTTLVVAETPARERATLVRNLDRAQSRGIRLLLVHANGATTPARGIDVPASAIQQAQSTGTVSERARSNGRTFLIEGTRLSAGDTVIATQDFSLVQSATTRLIERFLIAVGLGVVVAIGVGILVARLVSRPLRRAAASARLLADGRRGVLPRPGTTAFESPGSIAEITDVERALAALDAALATSEGRQHEFLLSISHEIRTPLTAIRGYAEALADGLVPVEALPTIGRTLVNETGRLDAFTRDLLELARLEADDFPIRPERLDLIAVARESVSAWQARASAAGVTLVLLAPDPVPDVESDPMRVRQLLDGLLENALRASPAGSTTTVTVGAAGGGAGSQDATAATTISVRDEGAGLTATDAAEAFERGLLAERYRSERPVGTGLGLSIAARLVRRLGGTIAAASPVGDGAEFTVTLPR